MIRIKLNEPQTKSWKRWLADCRLATTALSKVRWWETTIEISDVYRRKTIKKEVFLAKSGPFKGRCAYCESYIADFQHGDIEHFRPKKGVTDEHDNPITIRSPSGRLHEHPGYYWLAYDWKNLLPSCITCNQPGEHNIGKRNRFPTTDGKYTVPEDDVSNEKPLLINPVDSNDEDPSLHLGVDLETGNLTHQNSLRGAKCISVFGLNVRDQLVMERNTALNDVKAEVAQVMLLANQTLAQQSIDKLQKMEAGGFNHTLARRSQLKELKARLGMVGGP